jgi:hypothetical protein
MHLLYRRYARSGVAPPWFYIGMALAFGALAAWAAVEGDWLVVGLAAVMAPAAFAAMRIMRRVAGALRAEAAPEVARDEERTTR